MTSPTDRDEDPFVREVRRQAERAGAGQRLTFWQGLGLVGSVGWMVVLPAVLGAFLGRWIDRRDGHGHLLDALAPVRGPGARLRQRLAARAAGARRMNWIAAVGAGAGLGLAYFGGLWLTVRRRGAPSPRSAVLVPVERRGPARPAGARVWRS